MSTKKKIRRYVRVGLPKGMLVAWEPSGHISHRTQSQPVGWLFRK